MPELKVPETGGVVRRALGETAATVQSRAMRPKASKVPPGRNGWIRPTSDIHPPGGLAAGF